jgi:hypothetical protein
MKPEGSGRAGVFSSSPMTDAVVVGAVSGERKRPARSGADGFCRRRAARTGVLGLTAEGKRRGRKAMDSAFLPEGGGDLPDFSRWITLRFLRFATASASSGARRCFGFFLLYPILFSYI